MRLHETCTCGSEIEVEDDHANTAITAVTEWRRTHLCGGVQPWRRSAGSTTGAMVEFGFQPGEDQVMVRG